MNKNYELSDAVKNYMMQYSKSVIMDRAIVSLEDGLKPSQRLELWSLYNNNITHSRKRIKGLTATGEALKYVPHGDQAVFETMARMAQKDTFLYPLIDGKGNMGQHTGRDVKPSAPRYVEMRLTEFAEELFRNIDRNAVDFIGNFDNTKKQPTLLPTTFPSILTFGSNGIAVGFASNIPSFNLVEACQYTINAIQGKENNYLVPDFATKGKIIYDESELKKIEETGNGKLTIRGTYHMEGDILVIDSIPFSTTRESIIEKIIELAKQGKLKEVKNIHDGTDKGGMSIEIYVKNNTDIELLMAKLYKLTPLQSNFSCNMNVIYKDKPVKMGTKAIVNAWIEFRRNTIKRIAEYDLKKNQKQLEYLYALKKILLDIDKAISIIKQAKSDDEAIEGLMEGFDIGRKESEEIANFKLRNLNKSYIKNKLKSIDSLEDSVSSLKEMIESKELIDERIIKDLQSVMTKYNKERQTEIVCEDKLPLIDTKEAEIEDYNTRIILTEQMYLKKVAATSLRGNSTNKLKDGDKVAQEFDSTNKSDLLIFSNKRNLYKLKQYELEDTKLSNLGDYLPTLLQLENDEHVLFIASTSDYKGYMLIGFDNGKVAKIDVSSYEGNRKLLKNSLTDKANPIFFKLINEDIDLLAVSDINKAILLNTSLINPKGSRTTQGVTFQKQKNDSQTIGYYELDQCEFADTAYYANQSAGVGKYLRKEDRILV